MSAKSLSAVKNDLAEIIEEGRKRNATKLRYTAVDF
jgi:hypothetical protein